MIIQITPKDGEMLSQLQVGDVLIFGKVKHAQILTESQGKQIPVYTMDELLEKVRGKE